MADELVALVRGHRGLATQHLHEPVDDAEGVLDVVRQHGNEVGAHP
jgi:hypothetical protein